MTSKYRYEYHWIENRVVERKIIRPSNCVRWTYNKNSTSLIATIEPIDTSIKIKTGPASTDSRLIDALRFHKRLYADDNVKDIGASVPNSLAKSISKEISSIIKKVVGQYDSLAEETDITGLLKGLLHNITLQEDAWKVSIRSYTYNRQIKEEALGLDIGLIVDLIKDDTRIIKALWFQAKKESSIDKKAEIARLKTQLKKMMEHTEEAYTLVYSSTDIFAQQGNNNEKLNIRDVVIDSIKCKRGDRKPEIVVLTSDTHLLIEVYLTGDSKKQT